jgi:hypothetical protein
MDKSAPGNTTPDTAVEIENRIIDQYLPCIGAYGLAIYTVIKRHLEQPLTQGPPSYAAIAHRFRMDQGSVIRHVKILKRLHLLPPSLRFKEEGEVPRRHRKTLGLH